MASTIMNSEGSIGEREITKNRSKEVKKSDIIKEIHQINIKIQALEKDKSTHLYNKASEFCQEFSELQEMDKTFTSELQSERCKVSQHINKIKSMVKWFQRELQDVKPTPQFIEKLKVNMEDIENKITDFKEKQREKYEDLLKEEKLTGLELAAVEKRIETMNRIAVTAPTQHKVNVPVVLQRDITKDLPSEVAAFERYEVQNGGPKGGWDEYDHDTFLKVWNRHRGKGNILEDCVIYIPTKTEQEVKHHISWYREYLNLKEKKKTAIQKWKDQKENEKEEILEKAVEEEKEKEESKKKKEEMKKKMLQDEALQLKKQLNAWKIEQELKKAEEKERKIKEEMAKAREKELAKQKQIELKSKVEEFKQLKKQQHEAEQHHQLMMEKLEREARKPDPVILAKMYQRDMEKVKKKQQQEEEKAMMEKEKERRLNQLKSQVEVKVNRDPSRLYKLTEGWKERNKQQGPTSEGGPVLQMPHRAVPSWRQGLS